MIRFLFIFVLLFSSCANKTVAPAPVAPHVASTWAKDNILSADKTGILVTADFVRVYHDLLKAYGNKLPVSSRPASPDDGVKPEGKNFRVSYELQDRFADLKFYERNSSSP